LTLEVDRRLFDVRQKSVNTIRVVMFSAGIILFWRFTSSACITCVFLLQRPGLWVDRIFIQPSDLCPIVGVVRARVIKKIHHICSRRAPAGTIGIEIPKIALTLSIFTFFQRHVSRSAISRIEAESPIAGSSLQNICTVILRTT
jgi:hypothetical protein